MPDLASLSFDIDSTQAQRAIGVLEALKATSISLTQSATQQNNAQQTLIQSYNQQRDALMRLSEQTRTYDGTLQGLITRLDQLRTKLNDSAQAFTAYNVVLTQAVAQATTFNSTVDGLDRYVSKARELRLQINDLATGFDRMTAAIKNQTVEGHNYRVLLDQLGVSLSGIPANRPDLVQQALQERLRNAPLTAGTLAAAQGIYGPSFDANALMQQQARPYIPAEQLRAADFQRQAQAQVDAQRAQVQQQTAVLQQQRDELADLRARFTQVPTFMGRAGLAVEPGQFSLGAFMTMSPFMYGRYFGSRQGGAEELERLRAISQLPDAQRGAYTRPYEALQRLNQVDPVARMFRNFTSGTFSSNEAELRLREEQEAFTSPWGEFGAGFNRAGRQIQNLFGFYRPLLTQDTRTMTEAERIALSRQSGAILGQYGDPTLSNQVTAEEQFGQFGAGEMLQRYIAAFGPVEGRRRYQNQLASLGLQQGFAREPGTALQTLNNIQTQRAIAALPFNQRAQAQAALQFMAAQPGGEAFMAANIVPGTQLGTIMNPSFMSAAQIGAMQTVEINRRQQIAQFGGPSGTMGSEDNLRQIQFQQGVADALSRGRAAAEDYMRAWQAFIAAQKDGLSTSEQELKVREALNLAIQQRITQGTSLVRQQEEENARTQERVTQNRTLLTGDPVTRMAAQSALGITQAMEQAVRAGQLPAPSGEFTVTDPDGTRRTIGVTSPAQAAEVRAGFVAAQRRQLAGTGVEGAQGTTAGFRTAASDAAQVAEIMRTQNVTLAEAQRLLAVNAKYQADMAKAMQDQDQAAMREVEALRLQGQELDRNRTIAEQMARNLETSQQAQQGAIGADILRGVDPRLRPYIQPLLPLLFQNQQAGQGVAPGIAPYPAAPDAAGQERIRQFRAQVMGGGFGFSPEGAAAAAAWGSAESGLLGITEGKPAIPGTLGGFGYYQWTGMEPGTGRRAQMLDYARLHNLDPRSREANMGFFLEDLQLRYPNVLRRLQTPGLTVAQQSAAMADYVAGGATSNLGQRFLPGRTALAESLFTGGAYQPGVVAAGGGGPARPPVDPAKFQSALMKALRGESFAADLAGLSGPEAEALTAAVNDVMRNTRAGQALTTQTNVEQSDIQRRVIQQQTGYYLQGQTGLAARILPLANNIDLDLAQRQRQAQLGVVIAQQSAGQAQLIGGTNVALAQGGQMLGAVGGPLAGYESRMRAATAANQAFAESLRFPDLDRAARQVQLMTESLQREAEAAGRAAQQTREGNFITSAVMGRGIFATDADLRRTQAMAPFDLTRLTNPELAATPEQQAKESAEKQKQDLLDQLEVVQRYRDVWRGAGQATENALLAITVHGESAKRTMTGLVQQLADMAIRAFIFKPLENSIGNLLSGTTGGPGFWDFLGKLPTALSGAGSVDTTTNVEPYARGDVFMGNSGLSRYSGNVVSRPTLFRFASGMGLMGEAGPEAILPLVRTPSGNLGVRSDAGGNGQTIHINTPITVNAQGGGGGGRPPVDPQTLATLQRALDGQVKASVRSVLTEQRRPGGDLFGG